VRPRYILLALAASGRAAALVARYILLALAASRRAAALVG